MSFDGTAVKVFASKFVSVMEMMTKHC